MLYVLWRKHNNVLQSGYNNGKKDNLELVSFVVESKFNQKILEGSRIIQNTSYNNVYKGLRLQSYFKKWGTRTDLESQIQKNTDAYCLYKHVFLYFS